MSDIQQKLNSLGLEVPSILLPKNVNEKWPVIACDQFTQDRDYWEKAKTAVNGSPSTLNLIFPEVFLNDADAADRIKNIHSTMNRYLNEGIFAEPRQGFIYIERDTPCQKKRRGLVAAVDLEKYEWQPDARPLIRCTEGTVPDRLPPRMDIRRGAPLELPHVLLLIDDDTDTLLPGIGKRVKNQAPVYSTQLMMNSGSVSGWFLDSQSDMAFITEKLEELKQRSLSCCGSAGGNTALPFLFAVGDGNHSLAAAKGIWEEYKKANPADTSPPCRYALVEIENIYDPAIQFEPIHRIILGAGFDETLAILSQLPDFSSHPVKDERELASLLHRSGETAGANSFGIIAEGRCALVRTSAGGIATACLQPLLDNYIEGKALEIDYIHDESEVFRLTVRRDTTHKAAGILLPPVQKSGLFETVGRTGPLPRKSFSMGHSVEKRFYLECRAL